MAKRSHKVFQFHGGLNNNSDPRDIAENELSELQDAMVDELGIIRMMGGTTAHDAGVISLTGWSGASAISAGYGLIYFPSDWTEAAEAGGFYGTNSAEETGDHYLAIFDTADQEVWLYSKNYDAWNDDVNNYGHGAIVLNQYYNGSVGNTHPPRFVYVDGVLRVNSRPDIGPGYVASSRTANPTWYGYIARWFFGSGSSGYTVGNYSNGKYVSKWHAENLGHAEAQRVEATTVGSMIVSDAPDDSKRISLHLQPQNASTGSSSTTFSNYKYQDLSGDGGFLSSDTHTAQVELDISTAGTLTASTTSTDMPTQPGFGKFCVVGDKLALHDAASSNNNQVYTVVSITTTDPNVITVDPLPGTTTANDVCTLENLSRSGWFNADYPDIQWGVSTLFDDSKQESAIYRSSSLTPYNWGGSFGSFRINFLAFAGDGVSSGIPITEPRTSGFKIYARRRGLEQQVQPWYLQAEVDLSLGIRAINDTEWGSWANKNHCFYTNPTYEDPQTAWCATPMLQNMSEAITYEISSGLSRVYDYWDYDLGFGSGQQGWKAATVANRRIYYAGPVISDVESYPHSKSYPDAILKSHVNRFDMVEQSRRLEAEINDGDSIRELENYADRLLQFKEHSMTIINVSQELEFIEETHEHKGITTPASVCKTDFGVAWVNQQGVYFYDGEKVNNLLEKEGRQIIKESTWTSFCGTYPMIGYVPKKRQLIVADSVDDSKSGAIYLYDLITKSWTTGFDATLPDQKKTNFITDWNNDLVFAHTTGTVVKWADTSSSTSNLIITTKDFDFGEPGVNKKIYKVYVTYRGDATNVQVHYGVDGLAPALTFNNITSGTDGSSTRSGSNAKCIPYDAGTTDWLKAELRPSAVINNISSFRLKFSGDGSNAIAADFALNDITIIYRIKSIK